MMETGDNESPAKNRVDVISFENSSFPDRKRLFTRKRMTVKHSLIFIFGVFVLVGQAADLDNEYTKEELNYKINRYNRLTNGGMGLLIGGTLFDVIGPIVFVSAYNESGKESNVLIGLRDVGIVIVGLFGSVAGVAMTSAGIAVTAIGVKKTREYKGRLSKVSFTVTPNGVSLGYCF
jgi:hypothetical protein